MEPPLPLLSGTAAILLLLLLLLVPLAFLARRRRGRRAPPLSLLVVAGSGGHTTEILRLLSCLSESYSPRHYIFADSDKMSEAKIRSFEQKRAEKFSNSQFTLDRIPRSREVRQSWTSSVVTTLYSILYSFPLTYKLKPDLADCTISELFFSLKNEVMISFGSYFEIMSWVCHPFFFFTYSIASSV
ncbi:UDP-N-acetylglucosamine transferase subunit ALG14 isoform X2 [Anser cygnoides]|uniref:UDP-N-acetylglucosamine transferase subunit ALG14 isoform X2 n=1 Tax=Anser cygnoides TaxID=8845 RepID=UPI0034D391B6